MNALRDIYNDFVSIMSGALPGWNTTRDPCGLGDGVRGGWGGVVCSRNGNCSTTVTGLYDLFPSAYLPSLGELKMKLY